MLKIHGAQLDKKSSNGDVDSESDEEAFMQQQRISTKVVDQINKLHPYMGDSSSRRGSSFIGSGSDFSSSIEERKSRGQYFQFPEKRHRKKTKKLKPIEEKETKMVSTCTEEEDEDSEDVFWRKPDNQNTKSPVVYDKQTYMRFSEFSMLHHTVEKDSESLETPGT